MAIKPLGKKKKDEGPPWWDIPLAALLIIVFLAVLAFFVLQYTGPATNII